jgi:hypothetical protein
VHRVARNAHRKQVWKGENVDTDTIGKMRRAVIAAVAEPIREIVEATVGSILDQHLRQAMEALQNAPWPSGVKPAAPAPAPARRQRAIARGTEPPPVTPPPVSPPIVEPRAIGRTKFRTTPPTVVEERRNGRVIQRTEGARVVEEDDAKWVAGRSKQRLGDAPDPVDGYRRRIDGERDYSKAETLTGKGAAAVPKGERQELVIAWLRKHGEGTYIDLAAVAYPELGDTTYARKLSSINVSQWARKGILERVPNTYRPTLYRLPEGES